MLGSVDNLLIFGELFAGSDSAYNTLDCNFAYKPGDEYSQHNAHSGILIVFGKQKGNTKEKPDKSSCAQSGDYRHYSVVGAIVKL